MTTHDCRDRRQTNMDHATKILAGMAATADAIGTGDLPVGIGLLLGDQLRRLAIELEAFKARDLISMRALEVNA